jgi:twitching motility protein PilT
MMTTTPPTEMPLDDDGQEKLDKVADIDELLEWARKNEVSDVQISSYGEVWVERFGELTPTEYGVPGSVIDSWLAAHLSPIKIARLNDVGDVRGGLADGARRSKALGDLRIHAWRSRVGTEVTVRLLATEVPNLASLHLPDVMRLWGDASSGIVLFSGPTGSGKTTAVAALIDYINRTQRRHIVTVEDPVEYFIRSIRSRVRQCEVGEDVDSFESAISGFMRAKPHVIVVGEVRTPEAMAALLSAGETGHLIIATVHARDTDQMFRRALDFFPPERQQLVKTQLSNNFVGSAVMRLAKSYDGKRHAVTEICTTAGEKDEIVSSIRSNIREGKFDALRDVISSSGLTSANHTLERDLLRLCKDRKVISPQAARDATDRKNDEDIVKLFEAAR